MAAFVFKVFTLSLKTIAKPLAGRFQGYVLNHPVARGRVIDLAQRLHRFEVSVDRGASGKSGKAFVADLTEDNAVALAGKVVSEGFVWATAITILGVEYARQARKDGEKKAAEAAFRGAVAARADDAAATAAAAAAAARAAADAVGELGARLDAVEYRVRAALERAGAAAAGGEGGGGAWVAAGSRE